MTDEPVSAPNPDERNGSNGGEDRLAAPVDGSLSPRLPFVVVGVGASAGGLEAYTEFLQALPADAGMAYVLVQHLLPNRESLVAEILARHTPMPVLQVEDGMAVEPDHVYIIRPGHTMTLRDGRLHLGESLQKPGHGRPIDDFFRSLAEEQRERAVAVVLSGMGSNGSAGAEAVKAVGGLCVAQDPESAKFPSMPRALVDNSLADFIFRPAEMPDALVRYATHPYAAGGRPPESAARREAQALNEILAVLRARTRHDFTGYRKPTIVRRIQRRMGLHQIDSLAAYARVLRQGTADAGALADDLLIHVTGFFRDPEAWEALREKVIGPLAADRADGSEVRAWVAACATGDEAYTLAMLLDEAADARGKHLDIKVFATDMAERALGHARAGVFPNGIESEVPPERLERFFDKDDATYRVKKRLRDMVVFAPQNVLQDPPFSRLDIATCRNLLIYLEPEVQRRLLALLHFGLREGGALMLGTSETVGPAEDLFEPIDKKWRIFRRVGPTRHGAVEFPLARTLFRETVPGGPTRTPGPLQASVAHVANRVLLDRFTPAAVVVDRLGHIVYYHGRTERYLTQPRGEPTRDLLQLTHEQVRGAVRVALGRAVGQHEAVTVRDGLLDTPEGRRRVEVHVFPLDYRPGQAYYLVSFADHPDEPPPRPVDETGAALTQQQLIEELQRVRDELQSTVEEMQTSNEEMKASHEEVTSINEELQSTNEELETSKEELQSLNEELTTVNAQLEAKMEELERTGNDLTSLLSSTDIAVIFLDLAFRIRRFTPAVRDLFDLIPSDAGRPLTDLRRKFADPDLLPDAQAVLDRLVPLEREVASESGRWYVRKVLPYRTVDHRIDGVVVTFMDISGRKRAEESLREAEDRFRLFAENVRDYAVCFLDTGGRIVSWNEGAERFLGYKAADVMGATTDRFYTPEDLARGLPARELEEAAATGRSGDENWLVRRDATRFWASGSTSALRDPAGDLRGFVKIFRDLTAHRAAEAVVRESRERLRLALAAARTGIWTWDVAGDTQTRDENLNRLLGLPPAETKQPFAEFLTHIHPDDRAAVAAAFEACIRQGRPLNVDFRVVWPDGTVRWLRDQGDVFGGPDQSRHMAGACTDITELKEAEAELRRTHDELEARVAERTAELARANELLQEEVRVRERAEAARSDLLRRLATAEEDERQRVARDLHDQVGQTLTALTVAVKAVRDAGQLPESAAARLTDVQRAAESLGRDVHSIAVRLRPTSLDDLGLHAALGQLASDWSARTGAPVDFQAAGIEAGRLPREIETVLYRVVQESLTNVAKHARAGHVSVVVERHDGYAIAVVEDDGAGFDPEAAAANGRLGLVGMRERVTLAGGTLDVESGPGRGTAVIARVPLPDGGNAGE